MMLSPEFMSAAVVSKAALSPGGTASFHGNWSWSWCQIEPVMSWEVPRMRPSLTLSKYVPRVSPRFVPPKRYPWVSV